MGVVLGQVAYYGGNVKGMFNASGAFVFENAPTEDGPVPAVGWTMTVIGGCCCSLLTFWQFYSIEPYISAKEKAQAGARLRQVATLTTVPLLTAWGVQAGAAAISSCGSFVFSTVSSCLFANIGLLYCTFLKPTAIINVKRHWLCTEPTAFKGGVSSTGTANSRVSSCRLRAVRLCHCLTFATGPGITNGQFLAGMRSVGAC